jgi:hypothetical protein
LKYIPARAAIVSFRIRWFRSSKPVPSFKPTTLIYPKVWSQNMHTHNNDPHTYDPKLSYSEKKLSRYDMQVAGVVVYVVAMTMFFVIALVLMLFGSGTVTQAHAQARVDAGRPGIATAHSK